VGADCLFCEARGPAVLTNEHVNPQWLLERLELPNDDQLFQGVASSTTGELVDQPRIHSTFSFVQGRVCDDCNSGWMSRLETAAQPLLNLLMDQARSVRSLSVPEAAVVGKWAVKTAYLHSWTVPLKQPVSVGHLRELNGDSGQPVRGVGVFAMQSQYTKPSGYVQSGFWPQLAGVEVTPNGETPADAYKIGLQYRSLYLLVAFWPNLHSLFTRVQDMHLRLLPSGNSTEEEYLPEMVIGKGPVDRLAAFTNSLAVRHGSGRTRG
jgi:hypothetical protein